MHCRALLAVPVVLCLASFSSADSLWRRAGRNAGNLCGDTKARRVGDIVTVVIQESASITKEKETELKKSSETDMEIRLFRLLGLDDASHPRDPNDTPAVNWTSDRNFKGEADHTTKEEFTKTMTVIVREVLPNGNLLIEGTSDVVTDEDITTVTVSGVIRPQDITLANTISSRQIANARVSYKAKGPLKRSTRRGWLSQLVDVIWPF